MTERANISDVTVIFTDGEVKVYRISAGPTIAPFLARQSGETGILVLLNGNSATSIPVEQIREWTVEGVQHEGEH